MSEHKSLQVELKQADEGRVVAKFATLGVKDKDGDVIESGAFGEQRVKVSGFNHTSWQGALPVGVGTIAEKGDAAIADLTFFMDTTHGRDTFATIKGLGDLGEWSFGFDVREEAAPNEAQTEAGVQRVLKSLEVFEVSPVLRGAGVGTATISAKCDACAAKSAEPEEEPLTEAPDEAQAAKSEEEDTGGNAVDDAALEEEIAQVIGRHLARRKEVASRLVG